MSLGAPAPSRPLKRVFEPIEIGDLSIRNRIVRTAQGTGLARAGLVSDDLIAYHVARARGGVGLTILEVAGVNPSSLGDIHAFDDRVMPGYQALMEAVAPHGMRVFQQLWCGPGATAPWLPGLGAACAASPVAVPVGGATIRSYSRAEIHQLIERFAAAARRCREGGLDGVEIHAAHSNALATFLSPILNQRTDEYGGTRENRSRFLREVLAAVRRATGSGFAVGVRLSADEGVAGGSTPPEVALLVEELVADELIDFVDVSCGTYFSFDRVFPSAIAPHAPNLSLTTPVTAVAKVPTIVTGRFMSLDDAEAVLESGQADMVSMVRALIADPALVAKTAEGRAGEVRPCIGCNQGCLGGVLGPGRRVGCSVNAAAGREAVLGDIDRQDRSTPPLRVVVVGAGPGGLEAARVAGLAGNEVHLYEAADVLGGQLRFTRHNPLRSETGVVIDYWARELRRLGVAVHVGTTVDVDLLERLAPDVVIVATGSRPADDGYQLWRPAQAIAGWGALPALNSWQVLDGVDAGGSVLVYDDGGHYEAIDVVEHLLDRGVTVHYATRLATIGQQLEGGATGWEAAVRPHLRAMLAHARFALHREVVVESVAEGRVTLAALDAPGRLEVLSVDSIVPVGMNRSVTDLAEQLAGTRIETRVIGDAGGARTIQAAVYEGHMAARSLTTHRPRQRA
jgi:2,4-dienoyl-CoA reductase-like NADH-dependent reductase (Old Yellow Enzyme family)